MASRLSARRWMTRAELFAMLEQGRRVLEEAPANHPVEAAAEAATLSLYHFTRQFRAAYGETPKEFHRRCLVGRAQTMLREGGRVGEVAIELGFAGPTTFSRMIRRETGRSPRALKVG